MISSDALLYVVCKIIPLDLQVREKFSKIKLKIEYGHIIINDHIEIRPIKVIKNNTKVRQWKCDKVEMG